MSRGARRKAAERKAQDGVGDGEPRDGGALVARDARRGRGGRRYDTARSLDLHGSVEDDRVRDTRIALGHTVEG